MQSPLRRTQNRSRGFSLMEAAISAGVLGIGVMSAANLYTSTARGVNTSRSVLEAEQLAQQRIEQIATPGTAGLPACAGSTGCRNSVTAWADELAPDDTFQCTQYVDATGITDPTNVGAGRYRIDTVISEHPDPSQQAGAQVVTVSVCWAGDVGTVQQVQVSRFVLPEG